MLALGTVPLSAAPTDGAEPTVDELEAAAKEAAARHLDAVTSLTSTTAEREALERSIVDTEARLARLETIARGRAAVAYKRVGAELSITLDVANAGDLSRSQALLERVSEDDQETFEELSAVREELESQRRQLAEREAQEEAETEELEATADELNAALADARAAAAAAAAAAEAAAAADQHEATTESEAATTAAAPEPTAAPAPPPPPPDYRGTPGSHPQHNHPFLVCTRAHESGGGYSVVSAGGLYYGAYQFLQSTWNAAAVSFGRAELVGVPPNQASPYDQDDLAWRLYQAQGNGPWNGRC